MSYRQRRSLNRLAIGALLILMLLAACNGAKKSPPPAPTVAAVASGETATPTVTATPAAGQATAGPIASPSTANPSPAATSPLGTAEPSTATPPAANEGPKLLVQNRLPLTAIAAGTWGEVNTLGGCLKVRISFEEASLQIDCLPYATLVFVDGVQTVDGSAVAHLTGRGYVHPEGLTPVANPAETALPYASRPHDVGSVAFTTPDGNAWTVGADDANPVQITSGQPAGAFYSSLAWSANGRRLLMTRDGDAGRTVQVYEQGKQPRTVYPLPQSGSSGAIGTVAWGADSNHALVAEYDQPGDACERPSNRITLRSVDLDSGLPLTLYTAQRPGFVAGLAFSPDGKNVAVLVGSSCDAVSFSLCLLPLAADPTYGVDAGQMRCPPGAIAGQIAWSPDGKLLAYTSRLQGRGDESELSVGLPLRLMDPRSGASYPLAWPLRADRNIIGVAWLADGRTLRIEEEVPRGLTDTALPERVVRRITTDGSRFPITEAAGDRLLSVRPLLTPATVHGDYALATGARGELWIVKMGADDARWQLTDAAAGVAAWSP